MARGLIKRTPLKAGLLIVPAEHWPPFEGGLSMELAEATSDGQQCFKYTHSAAYHVRVPNSLEKAATCLSYASAERYYLVTHSVLSHKIKWICVSASYQ